MKVQAIDSRELSDAATAATTRSIAVKIVSINFNKLICFFLKMKLIFLTRNTDKAATKSFLCVTYSSFCQGDEIMALRKQITELEALLAEQTSSSNDKVNIFN